MEEPAVTRAAALAALGQAPTLGPAAARELEVALAHDPDARVRAAALGALLRAADPRRAFAAWQQALVDTDAHVRRRAADLAPGLASTAGAEELSGPLADQLDDPDVVVVVAAAWALGELGIDQASTDDVARLAVVAAEHRDPLAREAAVAALGALGHQGGLPAILAACEDTATVRRRAVLALAPFEGADVEAALRRALDDRDWQVRQAAEDLLAPNET